MKIMKSMFQERLMWFVMFPLPSGAMYAWGIIKLFIDTDSLIRYILIPGTKDNSQVYSDPPDELKDIMEIEIIQKPEKRRRYIFVSSQSIN